MKAPAKSWAIPTSRGWYERDGTIRQEKTISFDAGKLRTGLEVIANQLGKKLDEDNPVLNAQLPDGSRLAAVIPPDLLNSRFACVSISRASQETTLFTNDLAKPGPQSEAEVSKTAALEINRGISVGQGIGLGLRVLIKTI